MSLHIRQKKNSSGTISIQIIDRVHRKYKVIETIACVKNDLDLQIYLDVANKRLEELRQQMYPTLFDENKNEELIFIELGNNDLILILKENNIKFKFSQKLLRDIIKHMFALRTNGKLVYLKFDEIQQQVYDAIKNS